MARSKMTRQQRTTSVVSLKNARAAADYVKDNRSRGTCRAYQTDWTAFESWCRGVGLKALPAAPHTVALFVEAEGNLKRAPSTLKRRLAAIRIMHLAARYPTPHDALEVGEMVRRIRRAWQRPVTRKAPAVDADIKQMVDSVEPQSLRGLRDRALLLLGFAGAFRRSELVALDTRHLTAGKEGLLVAITSSRMDQEGHGQTVAIPRVLGSPYCPVQAVSDWLIAAGIEHGPIFRRFHRGDIAGASRLTDQSVALVVKELASKAGLASGQYAGHSLRSGFLTSAARNHASLFKMADQSRHRSINCLRDYSRDQERFGNHAAAGLLAAKTSKPVRKSR